MHTLQRTINLLESESCLNDGVGHVASDGYSRPVHNSHASTRRIHGINNIGDMVNSSNSGTDQLIAGVRERVTQFIMNRVKNEFEQLERCVQNYPNVQPRSSTSSIPHTSSFITFNGPHPRLQASCAPLHPEVHSLTPPQLAPGYCYG